MAFEVTENWLKSNHEFFNDMLFNGKLKIPNFEFNKRKSSLGLYKNTSTIFISTYFDRSEQDYMETLVHEMLHQYIYEVLKNYYERHGYIFKSHCNRINNILKKEGFNFSIWTHCTTKLIDNKKVERNVIVVDKGNDTLRVIFSTDGTMNNIVSQIKENDSNCYLHFYKTSSNDFSNYRNSRKYNYYPISKSDFKNRFLPKLETSSWCGCSRVPIIF